MDNFLDGRGAESERRACLDARRGDSRAARGLTAQRSSAWRPAPMGVQFREAATRFAIFFSANSTQPSVKRLERSRRFSEADFSAAAR